MTQDEFRTIYYEELKPQLRELNGYTPMGIGQLVNVPGAEGIWFNSKTGMWEQYLVDDWQGVRVYNQTESEEKAFQLFYEQLRRFIDRKLELKRIAEEKKRNKEKENEFI